MNATMIQDRDVFDATMNAVIIYDRFDSAAKANARLERAAHRTDETTLWSVKAWRVDLLKLPPAADVALAEAAEAHLIVLAVGQVQSLPPWLVEWLERWATGRQVHEAALAVWDGGNADTRSARGTPELSQFARHHGLSLIFDDDALYEDKSSILGSGRRRHEPLLAPTLPRILEQPVRDNYLHWGINE